MNTITTEEIEKANKVIRQFMPDDDSQEQFLPSEDYGFWEQTTPLSWSDFLSILTRYCEYRGWELVSDGPGDFSLMIFAHQDQALQEAAAQQEPLPFDEEPLPF
jgi:hypothetical protein